MSVVAEKANIPRLNIHIVVMGGRGGSKLETRIEPISFK